MSTLWGVLITAAVIYLHPNAAQPITSVEHHFFLVYNDDAEIAVRKAKLMLNDVIIKQKAINHSVNGVTVVQNPEIHKEAV